MFDFFRKQNYFNYEVIYRYGGRPFFSRVIVRALNNYEAQQDFDTNPGFEKCTRVCDAVILNSSL